MSDINSKLDLLEDWWEVQTKKPYGGYENNVPPMYYTKTFLGSDGDILRSVILKSMHHPEYDEEENNKIISQINQFLLTQ